MTEEQWLKGQSAEAMLKFVQEVHASSQPPVRLASNRQLRLFLAACYRASTHDDNKFACDKEKMAVDAEAWAETGDLPKNREHWLYYDDLARLAHCVLVYTGPGRYSADVLRDILDNPYDAMRYNIRECPRCSGIMRFYDTPDLARGQWQCESCTRLEADDGEFTLAFRTGRCVQPGWLTTDLEQLALAAWDSQRADGTLDPAALSVLADRVEEDDWPQELCRHCLGTGNREVVLPTWWPDPRPHTRCDPKTCQARWPNRVLRHLRAPGPHVRGCWAVDLLSRKELP